MCHQPGLKIWLHFPKIDEFGQEGIQNAANFGIQNKKIQKIKNSRKYVKKLDEICKEHW
jgi:hypothetical protein